MATERLSMRLKRSHRQIKGAVGVGLATVTDTIARATAAQLDWPAVDALSDDELEHRLYPKAARRG